MEVQLMFRSPLFSEIVSLRNDVERIANQAMGATSSNHAATREEAWATPVPIDVYSTGDHAVIIASVPGMAPDEIEISVNQNTVTLSGVIHNPVDAEETRDATWFLSELSSGAFRRSVTLPFPVDSDKATAVAEHGIVRVTLPKVDSARARKIAVSTNHTNHHEAIAAGSHAA
jgi:HSP20 family protein